MNDRWSMRLAVLVFGAIAVYGLIRNQPEIAKLIAAGLLGAFSFRIKPSNTAGTADPTTDPQAKTVKSVGDRLLGDLLSANPGLVSPSPTPSTASGQPPPPPVTI